MITHNLVAVSHVCVHEGHKNFGDALGPTPKIRGVADPLETRSSPTCVTKFGCFGSNQIVWASVGVPIFGTLAPALKMGRV